MAESKVNDILVFLAVVETGSFASAGRAFGLSRSTAGKAVSRLEDRYGLRLLNRTTRAISMTEEGQRLYKQGLAIQAAIADADMSMAGGEGIPTGTLRIAAPDALGRRLLMPVVRQFQQDWPEVRFEISFSDTLRHIIKDGFDLAVRIGVTSPDTSLISRTLMTDRPVLCASPSYLEGRKTPSRIDHLSTHDLLQFSSVGQRHVWVLQDATEFWSNAPGQVTLRLDNAEALREAALAGMGIALLPSTLVKDDLAAGALVRILPDVATGEVPIVALYPHKRFLEPRVRRFIDMLAANMPGH
ncbi:LysR family transcriptional regulator [Sulfitobacter pseudonitzschiae]|uniref:LysR family transcriptional regulator n=1 Tax=Pseudosulfitobacter pseudonitzschiae TaxID=1402135 RepID=A0A9Q2NNK3_9RHOB|nr:LysR family transcriptional regulator [Pseudosulfitobacter pseudonitzschiae]MBM2293085.1 LysR family transcriptional regulator [Pseudosulfitobacter pseudonitzschiae]MBM2297627.1 LysR family transcriptional regulator [Pseudosulfitobacter pseudonitzschiae]MBM2302541.1 LysR family transcriptional regulator [Pseudosulfitobacter pseudonitzschiae]MBM2312469.1 LysR family transcriptional regulator [Pseudosulfitobacter pseudonitzschiae]MBM2317237.1 LysR family transcriptional regulator [Pseudosulfi